MLGGLLGGLIGGAVRRAAPASMPLRNAPRLLSRLTDEGDEGRPARAATQKVVTIGSDSGPAPVQQSPIATPTIGSSLLDQPTSQPPSRQIGADSRQAMQESAPPPNAPRGQVPIEPPTQQRPGMQLPPQQGQPQQPAQQESPVLREAQPMDLEQIDPTRGVQEQQIEQQTQEVPPLRYFPTPNAMPSVHPSLATGSNDQIQIADSGFAFTRPEGVEDYAAKFTYRRR